MSDSLRTAMGYMAQEADPAGLPDPESQFSKGARAGTLGMGSSLRNAVAAGAEALGAENFAAQQYHEADQLAQRAGARGPRVSSLRQLGEGGYQLRDIGDYAAGVIGQAAPSVVLGTGAALATGGAALPALAGATAAFTPFEVGDAVAKFREANPDTAVDGNTALRLGATGLGSAALQSVVPAMVGGKIAGQALSRPTASLRSALAHNAMEIPLEGATEGAGELVKQYGANPDLPINWEQVGENAVAGAVGGAPMAGAGAAADFARGNAGVVANAGRRAKDAVTSALPTTAPTNPEAAATEEAPTVRSAMTDALQGLRTKIDDTVDRVSQDGFLGDMAEMAKATPERAMELSKESGAKAAEHAKTWGAELMDRAGIDEATRAKIGAALDDVGNSANQMFIAGQKKAFDAADKVKSRVTEFVDRLGVPEAPKTGAKKSEDYAGARKAVGDVLERYRADIPEATFADTETSQQLADGLRQFVEMSSRPGKYDTIDKHWVRAQLGSILGPRSTDILNDVYDAVGSTTPDAVARRFNTLNELDDIGKRSASLTDVLTQSLPEGSPLAARQSEDAQVLGRWARGEMTKGMSPQQAQFEDRRMRDYIKETYGDKADVVLGALESDAADRRGVTDQIDLDEFNDKVTIKDEEVPSTQYIGGNKSGKVMVTDPLVYRAKDTTGMEGSTERLIKKLQTDNPGADVRFVSVRDKPELMDAIPSLKADLDAKKGVLSPEAYESYRKAKAEELAGQGKGMIEVASNPNPDALGQADLQAMRMDTNRFGKVDGPSRLEVEVDGDKQIFDAVKVARTMTAKINRDRGWTEQDDQSDGHRLARAFNDGVAQLMEKYGRFKVPPTTLIGRVNGKDFTAGDIKKLAKDAGENFKDGKQVRREHALPDERSAQQLQKDIDRLEAALEDAENAGVTNLDREYKRLDALRERHEAVSQRENADDVVEKAGGQELDSENSNVSVYGAKKDRDGAMFDSGVKKTGKQLMAEASSAVDGQRSDQARAEQGNTRARPIDVKPLLLLASKLADGETAVARKVGARLETLAQNASMMSKADVGRLQRLAKETQISEIGPVVNDLARTYADKIVAPKGAAELKASPGGEEVRVAADKADAARRDKALNDVRRGRPVSDEVRADLLASLERQEQSGEMGRFAREALAKLREGSTPSPKAVAAKKAAFLERAASGENALFQEIYSSDDAKGIQRAIQALNEAPKTDANESNFELVSDALNERLGELMQDPDTAYGMGTKKYSLLSSEIHNDLGRVGFAATHDSQHRHAGKFDWRKYAGEGAAAGTAFGAGTYLSTGDTVHRYYKKMSTMAAGQDSPTYHVSVQAMKAQLMNWDKPLGQQPAYVQRRMKALGFNDEAQTGASMYKELSQRLGGDAKASIALQDAGLVGHEYSAVNGRDAQGNKAYAPNYVIYDDSKITTNYVHFSAQKAAAVGMSAKGQRQVADAIQTMLGNSVKVEFPTLPHAGEFETVKAAKGKPGNAGPTVDDVIRVSVNALNPTTVAYHESLHALFAKLNRSGAGDVVDVLQRATSTPAVNARLRELLAGEPAALRQLADPEERAAYMFQFWANGDAKLTQALKGAPESLLQRVAAMIRSVLGIWSNDERALHIMEAFSAGEFAQNLGNPGAFQKAVMAPGRNSAVEALRSLTKPLGQLGEAVGAAGSARLRESGVPSLVRVADAIKAPISAETVDPGYLPAARLERTQRLNDLGKRLQGLDKSQIADVLDILQTNDWSTGSPEVRLAAREVGKFLREQLDYLQRAGVDVKDLGESYFPRVYDTNYISKYQTEFKDLLAKYNVPENTMHKIIGAAGSDFQVEVQQPGMQARKGRKLKDIPDSELAPFMQKDLYQIMSSYVTQATRRAEWARRFGDDSRGMQELLTNAKKEGASAEQLAAADKYIKGVNGTLGDDINPTARRIMGDMIVYQNIRLLPLAIFSSVVDPVGIMVRGGEISDAFNAFKRGIKEIPKGIKGDTSMDAATELADTLGVIDNAAMIHDLGALYSQGMVGDTARKINDTFFRFNLMEQFNRSMRVGATEAALKFMEKHSTGTASAHSARWMRELGLMRGDIKNVGGRVAVSEADGLTEAQAARVRMAVNRWVDGAVLRPDAADKPIWMNDPHWALVAHLKQFVYAFHHTILKRVTHEARHGNYTPAMALASYVPIMIAADVAKGMLQNGGDEPEWKKGWGVSDYVAQGVQRAGLLGIGQLGVDAVTDVQRGGTGVGALAGPTIEQMGDALSVMGGSRQFESFLLKSMPANALYGDYVRGSPEPST